MADMMDQLASGAITDRSQYNPYFTSENVAAMTNGDPTDGWDNVNYIDKVFGTGFTQKHNVTVTGGSDKARYYTSFGYYGQDGNIDNFTYKRYNLRSNIDSDITSRLHFKLGLSGTLAHEGHSGLCLGRHGRRIQRAGMAVGGKPDYRDASVSPGEVRGHVHFDDQEEHRTSSESSRRHL